VTDIDPLELSVHIEASPDTVFPYFTDPERYVLWMGAEATLDARPGGVYHVRMGNGVEAAGEFVEIQSPTRVVFTWGWVGSDDVAPGSTRVVVTLEPTPAGTLVVLRHYGLPGPAQADHHKAGWATYLDRLAARALGNDPGLDPNA
jgi:uncharacterized protein YndB with AHSA1/START domain